jgi:hypothetical protein
MSMADDFDTGAANAEWQRLGTEAQRKWLEYRELKDSGDGYTAGIAMREAMALERAQRDFSADCRRKIEESQPRHQYVSQEQRAARQPHELDAQDLANMMNESKYRGRGFTADDYYRLRSGLPAHLASRGREQK